MQYDSKKKTIAGDLRTRYVGNDISDIGYDLGPVTKMLSEGVFIYPTNKAVQLHAPHSPTRVYLFKYVGAMSIYPLLKALDPRRAMPGEWQTAMSFNMDLVDKKIRKTKPSYESWGPVHGDDILYLFPLNPSLEIGKKSQDYAMSRTMVKALTSFSKNA